MFSLAVALLGVISIASTAASTSSAHVTDGRKSLRHPWQPPNQASWHHPGRRLAIIFMGTRIILSGSLMVPSMLIAPTNSSTCLPIPARSSRAWKATIRWNVRRPWSNNVPTLMCTLLELHFSDGCAEGSKVMQVEVPGGAAHANASFFNYTKTTSTFTSKLKGIKCRGMTHSFPDGHNPCGPPGVNICGTGRMCVVLEDGTPTCVIRNYTIPTCKTITCNSTHGDVCKMACGFSCAVCVAPCYRVTCPGTSTCTAVNGKVPSCMCPTGQSLLNGACVTSSSLPHAEYLDYHNGPRAALGIPEVTWSDAVATRAESWANQLASNAAVYGSAPCNPVHGDTDGVGQNLAMYSGGSDTQVPQDGVNLWVNEGKDYDLAMFNPYSPNPDNAASGCRTGSWSNCEHWTQLIWNATTAIGCYQVYCASNSRTLWVCNYSPPGNVVGQYPYKVYM